ncbi:hypothetical protein ACFTWD_31500 [Streptomyces sp. NPDC056943]|uniref:hypothetical protein n=1 Tax=Streptomyces sp. NPDC056943 TaxID=3345971 RepID=UPI0036290886
MTDEPRSPESSSGSPLEDGAERKPLLRRATDAWNKLGPAQKVGVISAAAVAAAGVITAAWAHRAAGVTNDEDETGESGGIFAEVERILNEAAAEQSSSNLSTSPPRQASPGTVGGYWRDQCLNPRGHASGNCRHERRWVDDYARGASEDEEEEDAEV